MKGIVPKEVKDIDGLLNLHKEYVAEKDTWVFRGHGGSKWDLATKLEREMQRFGLALSDADATEGGLLRRFKRQSTNYLIHTPAPGDYMEWFALMQHYGAPTRLLDWTYSFFVAAYFAVEKAEGECAIWALNAEGVDRKLKRILPGRITSIIGYKKDVNLRMYEDFEAVFMKQKRLFVCPMNPYRFNERLIIQQGVFLCPSVVRASFEDNLAAPFSRAELRANLREYVIRDDPALRKDILYHLHRMNMNRATLFPGLQGFAESLSTLLAFPDVKKAFPSESDYAKKRLWKKCPVR